MSDESTRDDPTVRELLQFDALDTLPRSAGERAVDDGQELLKYVVPPLRGLYQPIWRPVDVMIPNTKRALAIAVRSSVRAIGMLNN